MRMNVVKLDITSVEEIYVITLGETNMEAST